MAFSARIHPKDLRYYSDPLRYDMLSRTSVAYLRDIFCQYSFCLHPRSPVFDLFFFVESIKFALQTLHRVLRRSCPDDNVGTTRANNTPHHMGIRKELTRYDNASVYRDVSFVEKCSKVSPLL